jgi:hypothetical protein
MASAKNQIRDLQNNTHSVAQGFKSDHSDHDSSPIRGQILDKHEPLGPRTVNEIVRCLAKRETDLFPIIFKLSKFGNTSSNVTRESHDALLQ